MRVLKPQCVTGFSCWRLHYIILIFFSNNKYFKNWTHCWWTISLILKRIIISVVRPFWGTVLILNTPFSYYPFQQLHSYLISFCKYNRFIYSKVVYKCDDPLTRLRLKQSQAKSTFSTIDFEITFEVLFDYIAFKRIGSYA